MSLFSKQRTSKKTSSTRRDALSRARRARSGVFLETLEDRALLSVLDIGPSAALPSLAPGQLGWKSGGAVTNDLRVSAVPGGNYTLTDPNEPIVLGATATALGWLGSGTNTVTGPDISVSSLLLDGNTNGGTADSITIDSITDPLTIQPNAFGFLGVNTQENVTIGRAVDGVQGILASVNVTNPNNFTALTIDNAGDATGRSANVSATSVTGLSPQPINYVQGDLSSLTIQGGTGASTYNVLDTPSNVFGITFTSLTTRGAGDVVNVTGTSTNVPGSPLNVVGLNTNTVHVGTGSTQGIHGDVNISNPPSFTTLIVDDSTDLTGRTVGLTTSGGGILVTDGQVTGITASGTIHFIPNDVRGITLNMGSGSDVVTESLTSLLYNLGTAGVAINSGAGDDQVNVQATSAGVTTSIDTQIGGLDATNIGSTAPNLATSLLSGILGPVVVTDSGGVSAVSISGAGDAAGQTWTVAPTQITGGGLGAPITYNGSATTLDLFGGSGGNTFLVQGTNGGSNTTINSGDGDDNVYVLATNGPLTIQGQNGTDQTTLGSDNTGIGNPGTVQNLLGQVTIRKTGTGSMDATVDDTNNGTAVTATLAVDAGTGFSVLTGQAPATLRFLAAELGTFSVRSGAGAHTLNVNFASGNPIPTGPTAVGGGLEDLGQGNNLLNLVNNLPSGPFQFESSTDNGPNSGSINFLDAVLNSTQIFYGGTLSVHDTTSVINYTYQTQAPGGLNVQLLDTSVNGFNGTRIVETTGAFVRQDISNKQDAVVNVGSPFAFPPVDENVLINNPGAAAGAHNRALQSLTVHTFQGNDTVNVVAVPAIPNVFVITDGNDVINVTGSGVPAGTTLHLDAGPGGFDVLNYNASGATVAVTPGAMPGEVIITGPNGTVDAVNFEQVNVTSATPTPPVFTPGVLTINSVEGAPIVNRVVAVFHSAAPGATASDFTATINWGDASAPTPGTILQDAVDPTLFYVVGTHTYAEQNTFAVTTTVSSTGSTSTTIVNGTPVTTTTPPSGPIGPTNTASAVVNNSPLVVNVNPLSAVEGTATPVLVLANFTDLGFNPADPTPTAEYTATVNWGDGTGTVSLPAGAITQLGNTGSFQISGSHLYAEEGTYAVTITVTDSDLPNPFTVTATAPAFVADATLKTPTGFAVSATEGQALPPTTPLMTFVDNNLGGTASDFAAMIDWGDGMMGLGTITAVPGAPGTFSVAGGHTYTEEKSYTVRIVVADVGGQTLVGSTTATVVDAALTTPTGIPVTAVEGAPLSNVPLGTFVDTNPLATASDFTATITWGDGSVTPGVVTLAGGGGTGALFQVSGSHAFAEEGSPAISIAVTDVGGQTIAIATTATVADAPLTAQGATITGVEGVNTGALLLGRFTDADPAGAVGDYTVTVNWGDGTGTFTLPAAALSSIGSPNGVTFLVTRGHTYAEEGTYAITLTITDAGGASTVATGQAVIVDAALTTATGIPVAATEGAALTGVPLMTFVDSNPAGTISDFTATIDWGDGTSGLGTITQPGGVGTPFTVTGHHTYTEEGSYPIAIVVHDVGGQAIGGTTTATVADAPLSAPAGIPVSAVEGQPLNDLALGTFIDANKLASWGDFTVSINWGDGTPADTTTGAVSLVGGSAAGVKLRVSGSHTFAEEGTFPITITVTDLGGQTTTITTTATVADAPLTAAGASITGVEGASTGSVLVASFTDADPAGTLADYTVTVNWGDGSAVETLPASALTSVGSPNGATFRVNATHTYAEEGVYQTTVTIADAGGSQAIAHGIATIADAALAEASTPFSATEASAFTGPVASFTDANLGAPASDFHAVIDWGDGTPNSLGTVVATGAGTFNVLGTHIYKDAGVNGGVGTFPVTVNVVDEGGSLITLHNTANVADRVLTVNGFLSKASDSGQSNTDAITNVANPRFFGLASEAGAIVSLYAQPSGGGPLTLIGQGVADAGKLWRITANHLPDGSYNIFVRATDAEGKTVSALTPVLPNAVQGPLVIDTVGPKVINTQFQRLTGQVVVTFRDERSGLYQSTLVDASNYAFNKIHTRPTGAYLVNNLTATRLGTLPTSPEQVAVTINQARMLRGGYYLFTVRSASVLNPSGVQDVAGNALDGEFYGFFPSGNNIRGGDFVAELDAIHNRIFPARTVVGSATPVVPPGTPAVGFNLATGLPFTPAHTQRQKLHALDVALQQLQIRLRPNQ